MTEQAARIDQYAVRSVLDTDAGGGYGQATQPRRQKTKHIAVDTDLRPPARRCCGDNTMCSTVDRFQHLITNRLLSRRRLGR